MVEQEDAIGDFVDLAQRVRCEKQRRAAAPHQIVLEQPPEIRGRERIEAARRLVEQQHRRPVQKRAREAEAMRHARRERAHLAVEIAGDAHQAGDGIDALARGRPDHVVHRGKEREILAPAQARVEAFVAARVIAELPRAPSCPSRSMSKPPSATRPRVGTISVARIRSSVDFPAPLWPTIATASPVSMANETPASAHCVARAKG